MPRLTVALLTASLTMHAVTLALLAWATCLMGCR